MTSAAGFPACDGTLPWHLHWHRLESCTGLGAALGAGPPPLLFLRLFFFFFLIEFFFFQKKIKKKIKRKLKKKKQTNTFCCCCGAPDGISFQLKIIIIIIGKSSLALFFSLSHSVFSPLLLHCHSDFQTSS